MVAAKGNFFPPGVGTSDPDRNRHGFPSGTPVSYHFCPGMEFTEEFGQLHLFRGIESTHDPPADGLFCGKIDIRISIPEDAGPHPHNSHIYITVAVEVNYSHATGTVIVSRPLFWQKHFRSFGKELRPSGNSQLCPSIKFLSFCQDFPSLSYCTSPPAIHTCRYPSLPMKSRL